MANGHLVMPARIEAKAEEAMRRICEEAPAVKLIPEILDLADLGSVRTFAEQLLQRFASASLDLLINDAGVYALGARQVTSDGFGRQFATNYIGPFALTALLFPSIKRTLGSRVVTVASIYSKSGNIDFENLQSVRKWRLAVNR
jgi:NAD(P)-dependent dehydrogenase (short-subunit alcohol dehydrogenase family)